MTAAPRIYFDISELLQFAQNSSTLSGIQRVTVLLISRITGRHGPGAIRLVAYLPKTRRIAYFSADYFAGAFEYRQADFCGHFGLALRRRGDGAAQSGASLEAYILQRYGRDWRAWLHQRRLTVLNAVSRGRTFARRGIAGAAAVGRAKSTGAGSEAIAAGDILFLPGALWSIDAYILVLAEFAAKGVHIRQMIYDLTPLVTPEHAEEGMAGQFSRWLAIMCGVAGGFIAISQATANDLALYLKETHRGPIPCPVVRLAHEFIAPATAASPGPDHPWMRQGEVGTVAAKVLNAARLPYVLCVGTIESRKNVWMLARVWKSLHQELGAAAPRLLIAGRKGWLIADFEDFMAGNGAVDGLVRVFEQPSDADLHYLYRNCLFSVYPSLYEGWGLPIGESLWLGRPLACSNTSAMPEAGGDMADYFDPHDFAGMRAAIRRLIVDGEHRAARAANIDRKRLRSWDDVAEDLWRALRSPGAADAGGRSIG